MVIKMELRTLKYFLTVAREESISSAAKVLHITQPTLSRQLKDLEDELGTQLFERGNRANHLTLTEKGMLLRRRAEEIIDLCDKTTLEITQRDVIQGTITIGAAETSAMKEIIKIISTFKKENTAVNFNFFSGDSLTIQEKLDHGVIDFGIFIEPSDISKYERITLNTKDRWGILVNENHPLATCTSVTLETIKNIPVYIPLKLQNRKSYDFNIQGTYNLIYNAIFLAEENMGVILCLDKLIHTDGTHTKFIPLEPEALSSISICWKKYHTQSQASDVFLEYLRNNLSYNK